MNALKDDKRVAGYMSRLVLGDVQQFQNMMVVPLFTSINHGPDYLTLKEALEKALVSVVEVSLGGSVPELKVINQAELPVLLVDGEELAGARQNRVLNSSVLLREKSETVVPVSCSEQGRWSYRSRHFSHSGHIMAHKLRNLKSSTVAESLKKSQGYTSDQGAIWGHVQMLASHAGVQSPTHAMQDVFTAKMKDLDSYLDAFQPLPEQRGLLVLINGEIAGLDIVSLDRAYRFLHPTLVKSYALDALLELDGAAQSWPPLWDIDKATAFFKAASECKETKYPSIGYGQDYRFESRKVAGSALVADDKVIHMALYRLG